MIITNTKTVKTTINKEHTISTDFGKVICYETFTDDVLTHQYFKPKKPFHNGYLPKNMIFSYYGDNFNPIKCKLLYLQGKYEDISNPQIIKDLKSFNDFDKLYCLWMGYDGYIYKLNDPNRCIVPITIELWGNKFDLNKCNKRLSKLKSVSNIRIEKNVYQNYSISGTHSLYFYYLPSKKLDLKIGKSTTFIRDNIIIKHLGLDKFKFPEKDYDYEDNYDEYDY